MNKITIISPKGAFGESEYVYQRKYGQKKTRELIRTQEESLAVNEFVKD